MHTGAGPVVSVVSVTCVAHVICTIQILMPHWQTRVWLGSPPPAPGQGRAGTDRVAAAAPSPTAGVLCAGWVGMSVCVCVDLKFPRCQPTHGLGPTPHGGEKGGRELMGSIGVLWLRCPCGEELCAVAPYEPPPRSTWLARYQAPSRCIGCSCWKARPGKDGVQEALQPVRGRGHVASGSPRQGVTCRGAPFLYPPACTFAALTGVSP